MGTAVEKEEGPGQVVVARVLSLSVNSVDVTSLSMAVLRVLMVLIGSCASHLSSMWSRLIVALNQQKQVGLTTTKVHD